MPKKIAIIGATGYTGSELARILVCHPEVEIALITSQSHSGKRFSDIHPFFRDILETELQTADKLAEAKIDLAFLALPHGVSMTFAEKFKNANFKIIDLSGDFRLNTPESYEEWYQKEHTFKEGFEKAIYGLPELFGDEIAEAELVANPGCYPTSAILALLPLIRENLIEPSCVIIDSKSGTTGAGVKAKAATHFSNVNDNFKAYGLKKHRHSIEIQQVLEKAGNRDLTLQFTPHLLPIDRGILTTAYAKPSGFISEEQLKSLYRSFYADKPFVRLVNSPPAVKDVRGSNYCDFFATYDERTNNIIVISVLDNLVKGAARQAVQNMNIMFGFDERTGLHMVPVNP